MGLGNLAAGRVGEGVDSHPSKLGLGVGGARVGRGPKRGEPKAGSITNLGPIDPTKSLSGWEESVAAKWREEITPTMTAARAKKRTQAVLKRWLLSPSSI